MNIAGTPLGWLNVIVETRGVAQNNICICRWYIYGLLNTYAFRRISSVPTTKTLVSTVLSQKFLL